MGGWVIIIALLAIVLWHNYPKIIALVKNLLPTGHSTSAVVLALIIIALIPFSVWALWFIPKRQVVSIKKHKESFILSSEEKPFQSLDNPSPDERFSLENEARKTLAQIIGGVFVLLGLFFTAENLRVTQENAERTQKLTEKGQVTERFTKAITQLGDNKVEIHLGGIYALEKIAQDNPDDYHWTVLEILTAFVREKAPNENLSLRKDRSASQKNQVVNKNSSTITSIKLPIDIQAILTVIGRRSRKWGEGENQREIQSLDFSYIDLRGIDLHKANLIEANLNKTDFSTASFGAANLSKAYLSEAKFVAADLSGANLSEANLSKVDFSRADFSNAKLIGGYLSEAKFVAADLSGANLSEANLSGANLSGANLSETKFFGAYLNKADLRDVDLTKCMGLTWEQIDQSIIDENTVMPPEFEGQKQEKLKRQREQQQKPQQKAKQP
ncbi:MAG: hypothetical protein V7641_958 [Blastocatellia bacterium]